MEPETETPYKVDNVIINHGGSFKLNFPSYFKQMYNLETLFRKVPTLDELTIQTLLQVTWTRRLSGDSGLQLLSVGDFTHVSDPRFVVSKIPNDNVSILSHLKFKVWCSYS